MIIDIYDKLLQMKALFLLCPSLKSRLLFTRVLILILPVSACQTVPPTETAETKNDVCIGEPVMDDPEVNVDLEEMASEVDCL